MKKSTSNVIVILMAIGILAFLFWLLFLRDHPQTDKPPANQKNTNTPTDKPSTPVDASSSVLTAAENKEIQTFLRDFTQKYVSYDESKPTAHIESVKNMMTPDLYQEQRQNYQKLGIKNIKIRKINIDSIDMEERFITASVSLDVTVKYSNNYQKDTLFLFTFTLNHDTSGLKVGAISDESPEY